MSSAVRIGGVYAFERIAGDYARDRTTVIYVLGAFIRERSKIPRERQGDPPEDVKAGLRVMSRQLPQSEVWLDLRGADLRNADLSGLPEAQVLLEGASLADARLPGEPEPALPAAPQS